MLVVIVVLAATARLVTADAPNYDPVADAAGALAKMDVKPGDCPQFGVSPLRNNVSTAQNIPTQWDVAIGFNVKWSAKLGSQTYGSPVVANGKVFVGTNAHGYIPRVRQNVDHGVLVCFDEATGKFLWHHSTGSSPDLGQLRCTPHSICSTPCVDGDRLWYVDSHDQVVCLDTEGFLDDENDGPATDEPNQDLDEADVVWKLDLIGRFNVTPRYAACCSVTVVGDMLFVCTGHGADHRRRIADAEPPSFVALDKKTGTVLWTDHSPGKNILNGQWSSPAVGVLGGIEQAIFASGDGWLYSFDARGDNGRSSLLWKFDCNLKTAEFRLERGTRLSLVATPVIYDGLVYIGAGEEPLLGEGPGHLWCIDPTKRGDVSPTVVFNKRDPKTPVPPRRLIASDEQAGDFERDNENAAKVWHYPGENPRKFEGTMHRTLGSVAIKDDLLFVADASGLFHCLDAKTGNGYWTHDLLAASWSTPLIVGGCVYIADGDGKVTVLKLAKTRELVSEIQMGQSVYSTPIIANGVFYIATSDRLFAIEAK
jgi:outer membrane protein assembly factor BamB